jgi:hypothetical protein
MAFYATISILEMNGMVLVLKSIALNSKALS